MAFCLTFIIIYLFHVGYCLVELQSMEVVSCANKNICQDGKNLRIVLRASTIETAAGTGSMTGIITGGQSWSDAQGNWQLRESLTIDINYQNAEWEYQLQNEGTFWTKAEQFCNPFLPCDSFENYVECPDRGNIGLALINAAQCTKYSIDNVEKWEASVSIHSTHLNLEWDASNIQHSVWQSNAEISMESAFDTATCFQDLSNQYYVVVPTDSGYQYYYFISKQYWQDARNNFNLSVDTWNRDFDCSFSWVGWHTIIPFYENDAEYTTLGEGSNIRIPMSTDELYAFQYGYIPSHYDDAMGIFSGDCSDDTTFVDPVIERMGPPEDDKYTVSTSGIVDHFEITLDLDYTQFVQMPTSSPTPSPTKSPTESPIPSPSNTPTTTQRPTRNPTKSPTDTVTDLFTLYEIPAKLEIASTSHINISSSTIQQHIIESIASGLNYGREYIRLDSADFVTTISRRRLQTQTESLLLGFTVFTTSESDHLTYYTKLEQTSTYQFILASLTNKIPHIVTIFIANIQNDCDIGTKQITIAGQHICQSICALNQYYDTSSNSCKDQVAFIITTSITKDILGRILYFGLGIAGWIVTLATMYAAYKYYLHNTRRPQINTTKKPKQSIRSAVYSIGSTEEESSEYSESEYNTMRKKFKESLSDVIKSKKKKNNKRRKKVQTPLLSGASEGRSSDSSSNDEDITSTSESETQSGSESSTESD